MRESKLACGIDSYAFLAMEGIDTRATDCSLVTQRVCVHSYMRAKWDTSLVYIDTDMFVMCMCTNMFLCIYIDGCLVTERRTFLGKSYMSVIVCWFATTIARFAFLDRRFF